MAQRVREGAHQGPDPQRVPEHRHLRHQRRQVGGRRAGRPEVFFDKDVQDLEPARVGAARRPAAGADGVQPLHQPQRRDRAPQRGARRDGRPGLHHAGEGRQGEAGRASASSAARSTTTRNQQFFFDFVQHELINKYGLKTVRQGGLKVYTTLDPHLIRRPPSRRSPPIRSSGAAKALVSTDTNTGAILAMASSQSYDTSQFNLAADGERQPGSSFKPFVLTTAVDQGMDPDDDLRIRPPPRSR